MKSILLVLIRMHCSVTNSNHYSYIIVRSLQNWRYAATQIFSLVDLLNYNQSAGLLQKSTAIYLSQCHSLVGIEWKFRKCHVNKKRKSSRMTCLTREQQRSTPFRQVYSLSLIKITRYSGKQLLTANDVKIHILWRRVCSSCVTSVYMPINKHKTVIDAPFDSARIVTRYRFR